MHTWLSRRVETSKSVWLWTSAAIFFALSVVDPYGTANSKSLFSTFVDLLKPSHWAGITAEPKAMIECIFFEAIFLLIHFMAVAFIAGLFGWPFHFPVALWFKRHLVQSEHQSALKETSFDRFCHKSVAISGIAGASAAVLGGMLTSFKGLQFWGIWLCYEYLNKSITGYHFGSTFHLFFLLLLVCVLNAVLSVMIFRSLRSESLRIRLKGVIGLGIQLGSLLISVESLSGLSI